MTRQKPSMPVTISDTPLERLHYLKTIEHKSFRSIAALDEFSPCPAGTLCAIFNGGEVPHRWRDLFKLPHLEPAPVCAKCGVVHTTKRCTANEPVKPRQWVRVLGHAGGEWR